MKYSIVNKGSLLAKANLCFVILYEWAKATFLLIIIPILKIIPYQLPPALAGEFQNRTPTFQALAK